MNTMNDALLALTKKQISLGYPDPMENARRIFNKLDVSETTRREYEYRVRDFLQFVGDTAFTVDSFLEYKRHLAGRTDYGISTKNKYLVAARIFLKELHRLGMLPVDVTANVKSFQQDKKHKKDGLNNEEMETLVKRMRDMPQNPKRDRLNAIFALLALQGLRQIEIVRLDVSDIDFAGKKAFVLGKGRDDKEPIDLHPQTVSALRQYMKTNRKSSGPLFTSVSNGSRDRRLSTRGLRKIITQVLRELGIEKSVHGFRHFFTTTLIKTYKGDLLEVAQYTRHRGLGMLQVYNDSVKREEDLPRFYRAFRGVSF